MLNDKHTNHHLPTFTSDLVHKQEVNVLALPKISEKKYLEETSYDDLKRFMASHTSISLQS